MRQLLLLTVLMILVFACSSITSQNPQLELKKISEGFCLDATGILQLILPDGGQEYLEYESRYDRNSEKWSFEMVIPGEGLKVGILDLQKMIAKFPSADSVLIKITKSELYLIKMLLIRDSNDCHFVDGGIQCHSDFWKLIDSGQKMTLSRPPHEFSFDKKSHMIRLTAPKMSLVVNPQNCH